MRRFGVLLLCLGLAAARAEEPERLVIATDGYRPVAYLENGHPAGAICDVLAEAGRRAGIPIEFRFLPWARSIQETRAGRVDAIFPVFRTPERESHFLFPDETLMDERIAWFTQTGSPIRFDGRMEDLAGRKIGIINQSSYGPALDRVLHDGTLPDIQRVTDTTGAVKVLTAGRVDLVPGFDQGIWAEARGLGMENEIRELTPAVEDVPAYLAFTRGRDLGAESHAFDLALKSMKQDGSYQKILARYFVTKTQ